MAGLSSKDLEGADSFSSSSPPSFIPRLGVKRVLPVVGRYQCWRVNLVSWFPCVVAIRIPLPFDEVLKTPFAAIKTVINDGLDLVLFCVFD
jgi:hypothetical protein